MRVLIVTRSYDNDCVGMVSQALKAEGAKAVRLDTDLYPTVVRLSSSSGRGRLVTPRGIFELDSFDAIWYRRFSAGVQLPQELGDTREACMAEAKRTLLGTIACLECFQLDPVQNVRRADYKELQLKKALEFGLDCPRTLFSNDPDEVLKFILKAGGSVITKMQHAFAIYREGVENVVFTNEVGPGDLDDLDGLRYSPMTFQEKVEKELELRATVVGRRVFTASIDSQSQAHTEIDWRRDGIGLIGEWKKYQLPPEVEKGLLDLAAEFGLNYAAADFILTPDGRHVFLEMNAAGEWYWLHHAPGLPIAENLAAVLLNKVDRV